MNNTNNKSFIITLALKLFIITFIATLLLTICNAVTHKKISNLEAEKTESAMKSVISEATEFSQIELAKEITAKYSSQYGDIKVFEAKKNDEFAGYCINLAPNGYIDKINMIVGINPDLSYAGVEIVSINETPGLGAKAGEEKFYGQFADNKKGVINVVKNKSTTAENEINAVSGATISSRAVTSGANAALEIATELSKKEAE